MRNRRTTRNPPQTATGRSASLRPLFQPARCVVLCQYFLRVLCACAGSQTYGRHAPTTLAESRPLVRGPFLLRSRNDSFLLEQVAGGLLRSLAMFCIAG